MRIFTTKWFMQWAAKEGLTDEALRTAVAEMEQGLIDASLGGHVYKKRVGVQGRGKRGGVRTLLAFKTDDKPSSYMASSRVSETILAIKS
jgi:hypothetical protein